MASDGASDDVPLRFHTNDTLYGIASSSSASSASAARSQMTTLFLLPKPGLADPGGLGAQDDGAADCYEDNCDLHRVAWRNETRENWAHIDGGSERGAVQTFAVCVLALGLVGPWSENPRGISCFGRRTLKSYLRFISRLRV